MMRRAGQTTESRSRTFRCGPPSPLPPARLAIRLGCPHSRNTPTWRKEPIVRNNLFVGNLACTEDLELEQLFLRFGTVRFAAVVAGHGGDRGCRFGIVEMESDTQARSAIRVLDGF